MGIVKDYSRRVADAGRIDNLQSLTSASTGTQVTNYGATLINSTGSKTFQMASPKPGLRKTLVVVSDSTGSDTTVTNASTSVTFLTSTGNSIAFTGGGSALQSAELVGISTSQWAVISLDGAALA